MKKITLVLFIFNSLYVVAQNLVMNPSFEDHEGAIIGLNNKSYKRLLPDWDIASRATSDYHNPCAVNVPLANKARTGCGYIGLVCNGVRDEGYREFVRSELKKSLIKDSIYTISYYYKLAYNSGFTTNGMGVLLSKKKVSLKRNFDGFTSKEVRNESLVVEEVINGKNQWFKLCFEYKAKGGEKYITIGKLTKNGKMIDLEFKLKYNPRSKNRNPRENEAYVYIDDVYVGLDRSGCVDDSLELASVDTVQLNKDFDLVLLNDSNYMNDVVIKLKDQQTLKIYINGSNNNSKAIKSSFIKAGVLPKQIIIAESNEEKFKLSFE